MGGGRETELEVGILGVGRVTEWEVGREGERLGGKEGDRARGWETGWDFASLVGWLVP